MALYACPFSRCADVCVLKGHNLMQGIARVNRVFKDKPNGLIVDMLGIGDQLKLATQKYTKSGGKGELTESLRDKAVAYFKEQLARVRGLMPDESQLPASSELAGSSRAKLAGRLIYSQWRALTPIQLGDLLALCYGIFTPNQSLRDDYLTQEHRLSKAHSGYQLKMRQNTSE